MRTVTVDWKRVIGELALIIGGVLIALAFDSWRQGRAELDRETAYLRQLLADTRETQVRLHETITGDSAVMARVEAIVQRAFDGRLPPRDSVALPTAYNQFRPLDGMYEALIRSGDVQLLRSDSIRFAIISYLALLDATDVILQHTERLIWDMADRIRRQRLYHARTSPTANGPGEWRQIDVRAIYNDPEIISALQSQAAASSNRVRNLQRLVEPTETLIRLLESELGR